MTSALRVHHLNCGSMHPIGGRLVSGEPGRTPHLVCHCLLIETSDGLVLVDSGLGLADVEAAHARLGGLFVRALRPDLDPEQTAARQVAKLGFSRKDVRHILLTHLDLDHAGGLSDFPHARVHVLLAEHEAASHPRITERQRYRASQWAHHPHWVLYRHDAGEPWLGLEAVRALDGLPDDILFIPLLGHSRGHAGVAVRTSEGWLLHAGDAYFHRQELGPEPERCPAALRVFQTIVQADGRLRLWNQERLRTLARDHRGAVTVFSAHDALELDRAGSR